MTPEQIALSQRLVACSAFRWMPGMLTAEGYRITVVRGGMAGVQDDEHYPKTWGLEPHDCREPMDPFDWTPDLTDPATLGCILALVREAWTDPTAHTEPTPMALGGGWRCAAGPTLFEAASTDAEAMIIALEAA